MKTRKFALCLAAVFLVAIYINIQRSHTFTLSNDEGTIKTEQITLSKPFIPVYLFLILCPPCSKLSVNCFWKGNQIAIHTFPTIFQGLYMMNLNWSCYNAIN